MSKTAQSVQVNPPIQEAAPTRVASRLHWWKWRFNKRGGQPGEATRSVMRNAEPVSVVGDCMRPWFTDGDVLLVNKDLEPRDGDIVVIGMLYERTPTSSILGEAPRLLRRQAIKQLRVIRGMTWLASADGWVVQDRHQLEGVVIGWNRKGYFRPRVSRINFGDRPFLPT